MWIARPPTAAGRGRPYGSAPYPHPPRHWLAARGRPNARPPPTTPTTFVFLQTRHLPSIERGARHGGGSPEGGALDPAPTLKSAQRGATEAPRGVFEWKGGSRGRGIPQRAAAREDMPRKPLDAPWNDRRSGKGCRKVFLLHPCHVANAGCGAAPHGLRSKNCPKGAAFTPPSRGACGGGWFWVCFWVLFRPPKKN